MYGELRESMGPVGGEIGKMGFVRRGDYTKGN